MGALRGIAAGTLGLAGLEVLVSSQKAVANAGTLVKLATGFINRMVDPSVPLIPDRRGTVTATGGDTGDTMILAN